MQFTTLTFENVKLYKITISNNEDSYLHLQAFFAYKLLKGLSIAFAKKFSIEILSAVNV